MLFRKNSVLQQLLLLLQLLAVLLLVQHFTGAARLGRRERSQPLIVTGA